MVNEMKNLSIVRGLRRCCNDSIKSRRKFSGCCIVNGRCSDAAVKNHPPTKFWLWCWVLRHIPSTPNYKRFVVDFSGLR